MLLDLELSCTVHHQILVQTDKEHMILSCKLECTEVSNTWLVEEYNDGSLHLLDEKVIGGRIRNSLGCLFHNGKDSTTTNTTPEIYTHAPLLSIAISCGNMIHQYVDLLNHTTPNTLYWCNCNTIHNWFQQLLPKKVHFQYFLEEFWQ